MTTFYSVCLKGSPLSSRTVRARPWLSPPCLGALLPLPHSSLVALPLHLSWFLTLPWIPSCPQAVRGLIPHTQFSDLQLQAPRTPFSPGSFLPSSRQMCLSYRPPCSVETRPSDASSTPSSGSPPAGSPPRPPRPNTASPIDLQGKHASGF